METEKKGRITQVVGAVLDIRFPDGDLPKIYEAIHIPAGEQGVLTVEVAQHLGDDTVPLHCHGSHRWTCPGHGSNPHRKPHQSAGRRKDTGKNF